MANEKSGVVIDADAFDPIPSRRVVINGREYPALSMQDVSYTTYFAVQRLEEHLKALPTEHEQIEFIADLIVDFMPTVSREELLGDGKKRKALSIRKLGYILGHLAVADAEEQPRPLEETPSV